MLILTDYIEKHELKPLRKCFSVEDLKEGARKVIKGLGQKVRPSKKYKKFSFVKVRIGGGVKGRMVVLLVSKNNKVVPILIRLKKDKMLGMNMAANNPVVVKQIDKNLSEVLNDIELGKIRELEL